MLVKFSSNATESITMFGDAATQLIRMMGATGNIPGALRAEDLSSAITSLRAALRRVQETDESHDAVEDEQEDSPPPIALSTRAMPLIGILERAAAKGTPVMWERA
ncbi:MAG TPA: DUF1840 domain-containing protein [Steroidobacteraceae bacterium]|nr:DUF1840 domain-containing protein [Steroidobacteraceae bacterium]